MQVAVARKGQQARRGLELEVQAAVGCQIPNCGPLEKQQALLTT